MKKLFTIFAVVLSASSWGSDCEEEFTKTIEIKEAATGQTLLLDLGAGSLTVSGGGGSHITAEGEACASSLKLLDQIHLVSTVDSDGVSVISEMPDSDWGVFGNKTAYLNVKVKLPRSMGVVVDDNSGSIKIRDVASADIDDNSGSIEVRNISGPVSIEDGSGSITVLEVYGDVAIDDGSGSITIRNVDGSVRIEEDGSGSIEIRDVQNDVTVEDDGSGSIDVAQVGGDFTVGHDGSGGIEYDRIAGRVDIPR